MAIILSIIMSKKSDDKTTNMYHEQQKGTYV